MIAPAGAGLIVLLAGVLGSLSGGPGAGIHAAAVTLLFLGAGAAATRVVGSLPIRQHQPLPSQPSPAGAGHLVPDLLLARYARRHAGDVHTRLRPQLRRIAADLLASRHGLGLDDPRDAREIEALVGREAWDLIRVDRPAPRKQRGAGLDRTELDELLAGLERL